MSAGKKLESVSLVRAYSQEVRNTHLEDHSRGDNWGDTQLHECTSVTGKHHTEPV